MSCSRCSGCMVEDFLLDMEDSSGPMWLPAWRCMNCGNLAETLLERNRQRQGSTTSCSASSGKRDGQSPSRERLADLAA